MQFMMCHLNARLEGLGPWPDNEMPLSIRSYCVYLGLLQSTGCLKRAWGTWTFQKDSPEGCSQGSDLSKQSRSEGIEKLGKYGICDA